MFNFVMGIVMIGIGSISVARTFFKKYGGLHILRHTDDRIRNSGAGQIQGVKARKRRLPETEFDMYNLIASEMGVKINPLTGEMLNSDKKGEDEQVTVTEADDAADVAE